MKRTPEMTDQEWALKLTKQKKVAELRMKRNDFRKGFIEISDIVLAAKFWGCGKHTAEQRLLRGELPNA